MPDEVPRSRIGAAGEQPDPRLFAAATQRNREPILEVLSQVLPTRGLVLEIASGTGEHAAWFAHRLRPLAWQPSDPNPSMRLSIAAHAAQLEGANLKPPLDLDVHVEPWPLEQAAAVVCINMIHIAPWSATEALMRGAGRLLDAGGLLFLYGPFRREGRHSAPSNAAFDAALRAENPTWGVRDLEQVAAEADRNGLALWHTYDMPANNQSVTFLRSERKPALRSEGGPGG